MTLMEFKSCRGPQSVHASSPKCRSANSAILKGAPACMGTCLSAAPRARGANLKRMADDDDPTVENTESNKSRGKNALFHWPP